MKQLKSPQRNYLRLVTASDAILNLSHISGGSRRKMVLLSILKRLNLLQSGESCRRLRNNQGHIYPRTLSSGDVLLENMPPLLFDKQRYMTQHDNLNLPYCTIFLPFMILASMH